GAERVQFALDAVDLGVERGEAGPGGGDRVLDGRGGRAPEVREIGLAEGGGARLRGPAGVGPAADLQHRGVGRDGDRDLFGEFVRGGGGEDLGGVLGDLGGLDELGLGVEVDRSGGACAADVRVGGGGHHQDRGGGLVDLLGDGGVADPGRERGRRGADDEP